MVIDDLIAKPGRVEPQRHRVHRGSFKDWSVVARNFFAPREDFDG